MKKQFSVLLIAIMCSFILYAFSSKKEVSKHKNTTTSKWWDFVGNGASEQYDAMFYELDPNNLPDCPPSGGVVYCEVFAQTDPYSDPDDPKPDLGTITNQRMKVN